MASQFPPKKAAAFTLFFTLYKNDGTVIANPGTITKKISKDGGAIADITAAVTEINTTYGLCSVVLSSTEMNADAVSVYIVDDTTGCVPFTATIYTAGSLHDELKTETAAIKAKTDNIPASPAAVGSAMVLTAAYDAAKTAASQTSVNAIPTTPLLTNDARLANLDATISSRSTLTAAQVWANATRTLSAISDSAGVTTLLTRIGSALTINSGKVTVGTNDDKTGYSLATAPPTAAQVRAEMDTNSTKLANLDATISSRSTLTAAQVWANSTRTLSSFGTLVSDIATAVWGSAARTLTAISDSAGVTTLLTRLGAALTITGGKVDVNDKTGFALTSGERAAIATAVEAQIIDDTDSNAVLQAIVDKIAAANPSLEDLTLAAIASAIRTELTTELARIDVAVSTRLAASGYTAPANDNITAIKAKTDGLPASPAAVGSAMVLTAAYDAAKAAASQTSVNTIDGIVDAILVDTAVIGTGGAGLTALPWNAAWDAEVQSECTDALNAYDPPTNAEMVARSIAAAGYATATNLAAVDTVVDAILVDTNELQTDLANGGRIDLLIDGIKSKTDNLPADPATATELNAIRTEDVPAVLAAITAVDLGSIVTSLTALEGTVGELEAAVLGLHPYLGPSGKIWNYTCTNSSTGNPVQGVKIVASTDAAGQNCVSEAYTDGFGVARLYLVPGIYYMWRFKPGFNPVNPDVEVVS